MEANRINGKALGLKLDSGVELTYCELGKEEEVFSFIDQCHKGFYREITEPTGDEKPTFLQRTAMKAAAKLKGIK